MDHRKKRQHLAHFVALQLANVMPEQRSGKQWDFRLRFLQAIFADIALSRIVCLAHTIRRKRFGNGDQGHLLHIPPHPLTSGADVSADFCEIASNVTHQRSAVFFMAPAALAVSVA